MNRLVFQLIFCSFFSCSSTEDIERHAYDAGFSQEELFTLEVKKSLLLIKSFATLKYKETPPS